MKNKITIKHIFAIILILITVISCVMISFPLIRNKGVGYLGAENSVVLVYTEYTDENGMLNINWGTGFAIGKPGKPVQYVVTNAHIVEAAYAYSGSIMVYFSAATNDFMHSSVIIMSPSNAKDISVLKLPEPTKKRSAMVFKFDKDVTIGEPVFALGYPGKSTDVQQQPTFDINDISATRGVISKRTMLSVATYQAYQTDTATSSGNSGGPLVDEKGGFAVGIVSYGYVDYDMNYAITINELQTLLDYNKIEYSYKGQLNWMFYVFIPTGILSFLAAVVLFIWIYKKVPAKAGSYKDSEKKAGALSNKTPVIRGINGYYAGQKIELTQKIILGRDSTVCNLVFPADTAGVSSNHCSVYYDKNNEKFVITDNNSSYGTYIGNGQKLTASVPYNVSIGETFYLGNAQNRFAVSLE